MNKKKSLNDIRACLECERGFECVSPTQKFCTRTCAEIHKNKSLNKKWAEKSADAPKRRANHYSLTELMLNDFRPKWWNGKNYKVYRG